MEGTYSETHEYGKINAPALAFFAVGYQKDVDSAKTLPEPQRQAVLEFLKTQRKYHEQEIAYFRKEIPNGRVILFTNAVHTFPFDREDAVLRETREFLAVRSHPVQISLPVPVDFEIPMPPTPVKADGKWWLLYELHITNFHTNNVELVRVEVLRDRGKRPIATYTGEELNSRLAPATSIRRTLPSDSPNPRMIGGAMRSVMYLRITVEREADVPAALHHRLFFKSESAAGNSEEVLESASVTLNRKTSLLLSPPLRGEGWFGANGPSNDDVSHRRAIVVLGGKARIPQRFAIDWLRIDGEGKLYRSDRATNANWLSNNANWQAYGAEVLAVANAVVAEVKDGIPDNEGNSGTRAVPMTHETVAGNYVILDLGKGNFALYGHLQPKSIRVRVGQKVRRGQVLGLLGNSGNSGSPHLHFGVTNGNSPLGAEGVPYVFDSFEVQGVVPSGELGSWKPPSTAKTDKRRGEIPIDSAVIRFP
jgi:murein DD-endopeptidase MepM/ murein hydrolase activator NlpD